MTDYSVSGYADRYRRSRRLSVDAAAAWRSRLVESTTGNVGDVLDVGAGVGRFSEMLVEVFENARVACLDVSREMLKLVSRHPRIASVQGSAADLPFADGTFDFALCSMVLHYLPAPRDALQELSKVVRPGGRILIRQGTRTTVDSFYFVRFFPTARAIEKARMPSEGEVSEAALAVGLRILRKDNVSIRVASNWAEYVERVAARGFPSLQLIPDEEFRTGVRRLASASSTEREITERANALREETLVLVCEVA